MTTQELNKEYRRLMETYKATGEKYYLKLANDTIAMILASIDEAGDYEAELTELGAQYAHEIRG